jgi:hypothetical protein
VLLNAVVPVYIASYPIATLLLPSVREYNDWKPQAVLYPAVVAVYIELEPPAVFCVAEVLEYMIHLTGPQVVQAEVPHLIIVD